MSTSPAPARPIGSPAAVTPREYADRRARALVEVARRGFDGLLVWSRGSINSEGGGDVLYLSGHATPLSHVPDVVGSSARGHCALVLPPGRDPVLVTDAFEMDDSEIAGVDVRLCTEVDVTVAGVLRECGLEHVGLVGAGSLLRVHADRILARGPASLQLTQADDLLVDLRVIKSPAELELLREAARRGGAWMDASLQASRVGSTEGEAVGAGLAAFAAHGGRMLDCAVASGPRAGRYRSSSSAPIWNVTRPLESGDLIHFDLWGAATDGYYCDLARTTVVGAAPTAAQLALMESAIAFVQHLIDGARVGVAFSALYQRGSEWLAEHGGAGVHTTKTFPAVGHSLGLEVELPIIAASEDRLIEPGMVLALEVVQSDAALGAAAYEDIVIVHDDGPEVITAGSASRPWDV